MSVAATALLGCPAELPPPAPPVAEMPRVAMPPKPPGANQVRVVLDTPGERAIVNEVVGQTHETDNDGHDSLIDVVDGVCFTPCVHDFVAGTHTFKLESLTDSNHFTRVDFEIAQPVVVRHVLEQHVSPAGIALGSVSGVVGLGVGSAIFFVALRGKHRDGATTIFPLPTAYRF